MPARKPQLPKDPKSVALLFEQNGLQYLIAKAQFLLQIEEVLQSQLPSEFTSLKAVNVNDHTLTLQVCNAGLATRLRFEEPHLVYALSQCLPDCAHLGTIRCQVRPANLDNAKKINKSAAKSDTSAELVEATAEGITSCELKAALRRLAKTLGQRS